MGGKWILEKQEALLESRASCAKWVNLAAVALSLYA